MRVFDNYPESTLASLAGPQVSGKGMASEELARHDFMHISTGDVLRAEADRLGKPHDRSVLSDIAQGLHAEYGTVGALVLKSIETWEGRAEEFPGGLVIDGLRVPAECEVFKAQKGILGYIDAPIALRYGWAIHRNRSGEATQTFEEFAADDLREFEGDGDPGRPQLRVVRSMADFVVANTGTKQELHDAVAQGIHISK